MENSNKSIPMLQAFWYSQKELYLQLEAVHDNQMDGFVPFGMQQGIISCFSHINIQSL